MTASIIATQLTNHGPCPMGLYVDGVNVLKEPAIPSRYGVAVESITVTEAGPGGVSSMSFTIDDPSLLITIMDGAEIRYWDLTNNWPLFTGWVQSVGVVPDFGQQGRALAVTAYGIESLLDSVIVPSLSADPADLISDGIHPVRETSFLQVIASNAPLRAFAGGTSTQATPIDTTDIYTLRTAVTVDGLTIRQAFDAWLARASTSRAPGGSPLFLTVDPWGGLRKFVAGIGSIPSDYAALTLSDTPTGTLAAENLVWERDMSPGAIVNAVYVKGGTAAGTGWVVADTTCGRHEGYVSDATSTTETTKRAAADPLLNSRGTAAGRGSFDLTSYTPTAVHPGSLVTITDAREGWAAQTFIVTEITKTFQPNGRQDWHVSFQGATDAPSAGPGSAMAAIRSLTRGTAN